MFDIEHVNGKLVIPNYQLMILLESHLIRLNQLQKSDPTWDYSAEKLEKQISELEKNPENFRGF